jgi:hypothetical protein
MDYVEQYGEETADYLWETMHPQMETDEAVYIKIDGFEYPEALPTFRQITEESDKELLLVDGDTEMLRALIDGEWDEERFLNIPPGKKIVGVYDMDQVMRAGE